MIYYFVKMSSKWYGRKISDIKSYEQDIQDLVDDGDIVYLSDDIECFAEQMGIEVSEIVMVEAD